MLTAHPMGNFSVSHFTRFDVQKKSVNVTYVLDLAEIPTYQLLRDWNLDPSADAKSMAVSRSVKSPQPQSRADRKP